MSDWNAEAFHAEKPLLYEVMLRIVISQALSSAEPVTTF